MSNSKSPTKPDEKAITLFDVDAWAKIHYPKEYSVKKPSSGRIFSSVKHHINNATTKTIGTCCSFKSFTN